MKLLMSIVSATCVVGLVACGWGKDGSGGGKKTAEQKNCAKVTKAMQEMETSLSRKEGGYHGPQVKTAKHWLPKIKEPKLTDPRSVKLRAKYIQLVEMYISAKQNLEKGKGSRSGAKRLAEELMNNMRVTLHRHCPSSKAAGGPVKTGNLAGTWKLDGPKTAAAWKASKRAKSMRDKEVKFFVSSFKKATATLVLHKDGKVERTRKGKTVKGTWSQDGGKLVFETRDSLTSNADRRKCKADGKTLVCEQGGSPTVYTR